MKLSALGSEVSLIDSAAADFEGISTFNRRNTRNETGEAMVHSRPILANVPKTAGTKAEQYRRLGSRKKLWNGQLRQCGGRGQRKGSRPKPGPMRRMQGVLAQQRPRITTSKRGTRLEYHEMTEVLALVHDRRME